jgi:N-acetyl-anhydromuramyl-L-alanine amidase AmpD
MVLQGVFSLWYDLSMDAESNRPIDPSPSAFKQATTWRWQKPGREIQAVVIHSAETSEGPETAEALMNWAASPQCKNSWHYAVDPDSITQSVQEKDIAWHVKSFSVKSIGIEMAGRAKQTREEWLDEASGAIIRRTAALVADICKRHDLPVQFVDAEGLKAGKRGITTHNEVSKAFKDTDHYDPGPGFPMDVLLDLAWRDV